MTVRAMRDAASAQIEDVNQVVMSAQKKWQDNQGKVRL